MKLDRYRLPIVRYVDGFTHAGVARFPRQLQTRELKFTMFIHPVFPQSVKQFQTRSTGRFRCFHMFSVPVFRSSLLMKMWTERILKKFSVNVLMIDGLVKVLLPFGPESDDRSTSLLLWILQETASLKKMHQSFHNTALALTWYTRVSILQHLL